MIGRLGPYSGYLSDKVRAFKHTCCASEATLPASHTVSVIQGLRSREFNYFNGHAATAAQCWYVLWLVLLHSSSPFPKRGWFRLNPPLKCCNWLSRLRQWLPLHLVSPPGLPCKCYGLFEKVHILLEPWRWEINGSIQDRSSKWAWGLQHMASRY